MGYKVVVVAVGRDGSAVLSRVDVAGVCERNGEVVLDDNLTPDALSDLALESFVPLSACLDAVGCWVGNLVKTKALRDAYGRAEESSVELGEAEIVGDFGRYDDRLDRVYYFC